MKFLETVSSELAERWSASVLSPAFFFWAGGVLLLRGYWSGWAALESEVLSLPLGLQLLLLALALAVLVASPAAVGRLSLQVLRILEGYWPRWLNWPRRVLVRRAVERRRRAVARFNELARRLERKELTDDEEAEYVTVSSELLRTPRDPHEAMPTRVGNAIRASELRPRTKYGLDAIHCWPRLWLLLPEFCRAELTDARSRLNSDVELIVWGLLFCVWSPLSLWAALVGILVALFGYRSLITEAEVYGDLVEATFDLYRGRLYEAMGWPVPSTPAEELQTGPEFTRYLVRGSDRTTPRLERKI